MTTTDIITRAKAARKPEQYRETARTILAALYQKAARNHRAAMRVHARLWRMTWRPVDRSIHLADAREQRWQARRCQQHAEHILAGGVV